MKYQTLMANIGYSTIDYKYYYFFYYYNIIQDL